MKEKSERTNQAGGGQRRNRNGGKKMTAIIIGSLALLAVAFLAGWILGEEVEHRRAKKIIGGKEEAKDESLQSF